MINLFIDFRIIDFLDITLVAIIMFYLYKMLKDTIAFSILIAIFSIFVISIVVTAFKMQLLSSIFKEIIGIGSIAIVVVFQKEIRVFLLSIGNKYQSPTTIINKIFRIKNNVKIGNLINDPILIACKDMARERTGALIVIGKKVGLKDFYSTGVAINADIKTDLIKSIFFKNSPLHDGALIINQDKIIAARCILPVSDSSSISGKFGLRHRAAIGISEISDSHVIVVSEETGSISFVKDGNIIHNINIEELSKLL
jgi:uncharacterized protein (TIGR00159 family)